MITFQRDRYIMRIRRKNDTYHTVIEIGTLDGGVDRVGHLKSDRAADFVKFLAAFLSDEVAVVADDD